MAVTSADLWKLLRQSRLLSAERLEQVRGAFAQSGNQPDQVPAKALAQWLLQRQMLTAYQANVLLNGRPGPFHYGDYQIQDRIRGGRLSKTFIAIHLPTRFGVQLKFAGSHIAQDPRQWNTARQYIHTVTPIVHDQLQRVFALEDQAGYRFLVLERLLGSTLALHLNKHGRLSVPDACHLVRLAALGLAALHEQRQAHGDLRPENLWLDSHGNVKLLRDRLHPPNVPALWQPDTTESQVRQADYMAPELAHPGTPLGSATDIYALGCTLYELLQGNTPFAGGDVAEKLHRHATQPIQPIQLPSEHAELATVIAQLLAKEPSARPAHAATVAELLSPFIESSRRETPEFTPSATLLAFQEALGQTTAVPAAPPPVISEPDDHPQLREPPVQATSSAVHVTQELAVETTPEPVHDPSPPSKEIDVVSQPRHSKAMKRLRRKRWSRRKQAITLSALASILLIVTGILVTREPHLRARLWGTQQGVPVAERNGPPDPKPRKRVAQKVRQSTSNIDSPAQYEQRGDDGKLLWMTPTEGEPVSLQYVAPGAQLLMIVRPHELMTSPNGPLVLRALGPNFKANRQNWEQVAGITFDEIDQLVACWHTTEATPVASMIVQLRQPTSTDELLTSWGNPSATNFGGTQYYVSDEWAFFIPDQKSASRFVMAREPTIREVIDERESPPLLRRELARLLQKTDYDRHVTLLFAPDFLEQDSWADDAFPVNARRVRESLSWLLTSDVKACLMSMQFDDLFFVEMRAYGAANVASIAVADTLRDRLAEIPDQIESLFAEIYPSVYWRRVALRFPEMVRFLLRYTRVGVEDDQAIINAVLPGQAAHNLVFGTEMLLNMGADGESDMNAKPAATPSVPNTMDELIGQSMDLSFDQKSLEFAIQDLAADIRETYPTLPFAFDIQIVGSDLQLNGITRNQQISEFTADNKTIAEILTGIVMRANPVTTVTDPSEIDQKLVWVIGPDPVDPKRRVLLITTRDAAQREGYKLPAPFQPK